MPWWLWVITVGAGLWLVLFGCDLVSRLGFQSAIRFNHFRGSDSSVLFVHFPGLVGDGVTQIQPVMDILRWHGDVLCVSHVLCDGTGRERFSRNFMTRRAANRLAYDISMHEYHRVVLVGTSQGGKHAYHIGERLEKRGILTDKILIDSPRGWTDLAIVQQLLSPLMIVLPFGALWNRLSPWAMKFLFIPPDEATIDPVADRRKLAATVRAAQASLLSFYRDQIVDILWPARMKNGAWSDDHVAFIWSLRGEDVVRGGHASHGWDRIAGGNLHLYEVDAKHVAYGEHPTAYREALPEVLRDMGL